MAAKKRAAAAAVHEPAELPPVAGFAYASLRLKAQGHKLRFSHGPMLVQATDDQTITFRKEPYPHFVVLPGGVEFPLENVASALNTEASVVQKLSRTGRLNARKQRLMKAAEEKRMAQVQRVDDEDNDPLASEGDDDES